MERRGLVGAYVAEWGGLASCGCPPWRVRLNASALWSGFGMLWGGVIRGATTRLVPFRGGVLSSRALQVSGSASNPPKPIQLALLNPKRK